MTTVARRELGPSDTLVCPSDEYEFRPYFAMGACPLCGWTPEDVTVARPWSHRTDWALVGFGTLVIVAIMMTIAVVGRL
jgi:hypothetical protein